MYIVIDSKLVNGCEIQNSCDARAQIMRLLKLVKSKVDEEAYLATVSEDMVQPGHGSKVLHDTKVIMDLIDPWRGGSTERTVCADSYFASGGTLEELKKTGLYFIDIIKTAMRM